jgi:hypothetical protein
MLHQSCGPTGVSLEQLSDCSCAPVLYPDKRGRTATEETSDRSRKDRDELAVKVYKMHHQEASHHGHYRIHHLYNFEGYFH